MAKFVKQIPDDIDLREVFDEHKFGGARIRPVRMDAAMTARVVPMDGGVGLDMVWTLLIEERKEIGPRMRTRWQPVCTLVAESADGLPKLLRDVADLIEHGKTPVTRSEVSS